MRAAVLMWLLLAVAGAFALWGPACSVETPPELADILARFDVPTADTADTSTTPDTYVRPDGGIELDGGCPEGAPCDDGDPCTTGDMCRAGVCFGPFPTDCDDGDPCTDDRCAAPVGCVHVRLDTPECRSPIPCPTPCDDGDPCTRDTCDETEGRCVTEAIANCRACDPEGDWEQACDDRDPNTQDACVDDPLLGGFVCHHTPLPCGLDPADCDDDDPCTEDSLGNDCICHHAPLSGTACDDGDPCTGGDTCETGVCIPGETDLCGT